jgi:hypothetical protein
MSVMVTDTHTLAHRRSFTPENLHTGTEGASQRTPLGVATIGDGVAMALRPENRGSRIPGDPLTTIGKHAEPPVAIDDEQSVE